MVPSCNGIPCHFLKGEWGSSPSPSYIMWNDLQLIAGVKEMGCRTVCTEYCYLCEKAHCFGAFICIKSDRIQNKLMTLWQLWLPGRGTGWLRDSDRRETFNCVLFWTLWVYYLSKIQWKKFNITKIPYVYCVYILI